MRLLLLILRAAAAAHGSSGVSGASEARLTIGVEPLAASQLLRSEAPNPVTVGRRSWPWGADKSNSVVLVSAGGDTHLLGLRDTAPAAADGERMDVSPIQQLGTADASKLEQSGDHAAIFTTIPVDKQALESAPSLGEDTSHNIELMPPLPVLVPNNTGGACLKLLRELRIINATLVHVLNMTKAKIHFIKHILIDRLNRTKHHLQLVRSDLTARLNHTKAALKQVARKLIGKLSVYKGKYIRSKAHWRKRKKRLYARLRHIRAKISMLGTKMKDIMIVLGSKAKSLKNKLAMVKNIIKPAFKNLGKKVKAFVKKKLPSHWKKLKQEFHKAKRRHKEDWKKAKETAKNTWRVVQEKARHFQKPFWLR